MIRGLVSATNPLTRAPNGRRLGLLLAPSSPAGRDSTAVTHTPDRDIPASLPGEPAVKGSRVPRHCRRCPDPDIRGGRFVLAHALRRADDDTIETSDERLRNHLWTADTSRSAGASGRLPALWNDPKECTSHGGRLSYGR
ncbi:hypothetical protein GCM10010335_14610 [Streptomyces galbus]|nr:hypothetical protein GCM10010335_14610 [Streptomyces galbus]